MKYKKFWILYDGREKIEDVQEECSAILIGEIGSGSYADGITGVMGYFIRIPINKYDNDTKEYRKALIQYLIKRETRTIQISTSEILKLTDKL
jgi:hypothetical protein